MIDRAGLKPNPVLIGTMVTQPIKRREKMEKTKKKWVDDLTLLACIDLKRTLVQDPNPVRPMLYRGRAEQIMPREANILQDEVAKVEQLSISRKMQLNPLKTKVMTYNPLRK